LRGGYSANTLYFRKKLNNCAHPEPLVSGDSRIFEIPLQNCHPTKGGTYPKGWLTTRGNIILATRRRREGKGLRRVRTNQKIYR